jgi:hypothetical protein
LQPRNGSGIDTQRQHFAAAIPKSVIVAVDGFQAIQAAAGARIFHAGIAGSVSIDDAIIIIIGIIVVGQAARRAGGIIIAIIRRAIIIAPIIAIVAVIGTTAGLASRRIIVIAIIAAAAGPGTAVVITAARAIVTAAAAAGIVGRAIIIGACSATIVTATSGIVRIGHRVGGVIVTVIIIVRFGGLGHQRPRRPRAGLNQQRPGERDEQQKRTAHKQ